MNATKISSKEHWEEIHGSGPREKMGWFQAQPHDSMAFIRDAGLSGELSVIDIGAGESELSSVLMDLGVGRLTILDISETAILKAKQRFGPLHSQINWVRSDVLAFSAEAEFDLWHDRACFHFLTSESDIRNYVQTARKALKPGSHLIIGTFSHEGPSKCSGLPVQRYDHRSLEKVFSGFELLTYEYLDHVTPSGNRQNYIFCLFKSET